MQGCWASFLIAIFMTEKKSQNISSFIYLKDVYKSEGRQIKGNNHGFSLVIS